MKNFLKAILTSALLSTSFITIAFAECECKCDEKEGKWQGISLDESTVYFKTFDISNHDKEFSGHTVKKHIGKNNDWLDGRLAGSRHEKFVSSYTDLAIANEVIKTIVIENESKIKHWIEDEEKDKVILTKKFDKKIGMALKKKGKELKDCNVGVVVLKRPHKTAEKFYIATSYPVINIGDVESDHKEWKSKNNGKYPMNH